MKTARWIALVSCAGLSMGCGSVNCEDVLSGVIQDGSFTLGMACWTASAPEIAIQESEDGAESSIRVAAPVADSAQDSVALVSSTFVLDDREPMTLRFRARGDAQRSLWIDIRGKDSGLRGYWNRVTLEPAWQDYTLEFESNATADDSVLAFWFGEQAVGAELDDVALTRE